MKTYRTREAMTIEPKGHHIVGYADGSCGAGDRLGGWGYVFHDGLDVFEDWGHESDTTNNQMELEAALRCMQHLIDLRMQRRPVLIVCDSQYVAFGATREDEWERRRWDKIKNVSNWQMFFEHQRRFDHISFAWVKGHAGHYWNEYVDRLADQGRKRAIEERDAERRERYGRRI